MLRLTVRGLSFILGLGLLLSGVWGPQFKTDTLVAGVALIVSATLSSSRLQQFWALSLLFAGIVCLLIRIVIVVTAVSDTMEMILQASILLLCMLLLGHTTIREGKARLQAVGWL